MTDSIFQRIKKQASGKRGVSFCLLAASIACSLLTLILYTHTGTNSFTPVLSGPVVALLWVCISFSVLMAVFEIKNGKYVLYLLLFWTWLKFLVYNASYISNVLVGIDGNQFSIGFILTAIFGLLAWSGALGSAILQKNELGSLSPTNSGIQTEG